MNTVSLAKAVEGVLRQGLTLLTDLDSASFEAVAPAPYNASIGQHYRHVLDHFLCLEKGIVSGQIDYDMRDRDPRLETDIRLARAVTNRLIGDFASYGNKLLDQQCTVRYTVGYGGVQPVLLPTAVARELAFCVGHAVHHYAIIRLLCDSFGIGVVPEFGVAPSTLRYRSEHLAG